MKRHISGTIINGVAFTLCGIMSTPGTYSGAAYQGLVILGCHPSGFCTLCQRAWIKAFNIESPWVCSICQLRFSTEGSFTLHMEIHAHGL